MHKLRLGTCSHGIKPAERCSWCDSTTCVEGMSLMSGLDVGQAWDEWNEDEEEVKQSTDGHGFDEDEEDW